MVDTIGFAADIPKQIAQFISPVYQTNKPFRNARSLDSRGIIRTLSNIYGGVSCDYLAIEWRNSYVGILLTVMLTIMEISMKTVIFRFLMKSKSILGYPGLKTNLL